MSTFKVLAFCAAMLLSSLGHALTLAPYTPEAFANAQAAGQAVVLHFHADWCPTCRAQDKALESLKALDSLPVTVFAVDYDKESALKSKVKVRAQSTFVVYRGAQERARQTGETSADGIRALLSKAL